MGTVLALAVALCGCGVAGHGHDPPSQGHRAHHRLPGPGGGTVATDGRGSGARQILHGHPQAIEPLAGQQAGTSTTAAQSSVGVGGAASGGSLQQPISNDDVEAELAASGISADPNQATLTAGGLALPPINAPAAVQAVINAGNQIARLPYLWGGGHETFEDTAYDCSGSLSFILAAGGLLNQTETSGQLMSYGDPGPGKWITIFANDGHTFAYIAGLRFDTVALAETGTRWSNRSADEPDLSSFAIRHPAGL